MNFQAWIKAQLRYLDKVRHHDKADLVGRLPVHLGRTERRATAAGLSAAVKPCWAGVFDRSRPGGPCSVLGCNETGEVTGTGGPDDPAATGEVAEGVGQYGPVLDSQWRPTAVNLADPQRVRPRYRISADALAEFQARAFRVTTGQAKASSRDATLEPVTNIVRDPQEWLIEDALPIGGCHRGRKMAHDVVQCNLLAGRSTYRFQGPSEAVERVPLAVHPARFK